MLSFLVVAWPMVCVGFVVTGVLFLALADLGRDQ